MANRSFVRGLSTSAPAPLWQTWTPVFKQSATITTTIASARYLQVGRLVTVQAFVTATSSGTSGQVITFSLPVAIAGTALTRIIGTADFLDTSATLRLFLLAETNASATEIRFKYANSTSGDPTFGSGGSFSTSVASGDTLSISVMYES